MPENNMKQANYEQALIDLLKEYADYEGTTAMDGLVKVIAEMQIKIESLEKIVEQLRRSHITLA